MAGLRQLVLGESLNKELEKELRGRGRDAQSVYSLGYTGLKDPQLLPKLAGTFRDFVLVTADDRMPGDHGALIAKHGLTVATVDPVVPPGYSSKDHWRRELVHRWAHKMQEQPGGSILRYGGSGGRRWTGQRRTRPTS